MARALVAGGIPVDRSHPAHAGRARRGARDRRRSRRRLRRRGHRADRARSRERVQGRREVCRVARQSPRLLDAADDHELPLLPGAATSSEAMALLERGYRFQKFFPAVPAGGPKLIGAWASPLPQIRFCPTGGISLANAPDFLSLPNVVCVGGSWLTPANLLRRRIGRPLKPWRARRRSWAAESARPIRIGDRPHRGLLPGASMRWGRQPLRWCRRRFLSVLSGLSGDHVSACGFDVVCSATLTSPGGLANEKVAVTGT